MRRRLAAGIAVAAVLLVTTGGVLVLQQASTATAPSATSVSSGNEPPPSSRETPSPSTSPPAALPGSSSSAAPGESTEARGTEPDAPVDTPPGSTPLPALVTLPLPDTSSAVGSVVAGFPDRVLPAAPQSTIASSSVAAEGSRLQATLSAETSLTPLEVLDFYRTTLAEVGLVDAPVPAVDGSTALAFTRGLNTVTLTVTPIENGSQYTVFGTFSAES
ncbi:hypothetical protein E3O42_00060 [Cryobacterium adonitolivorans]|uniref:Uncharacterized protein n=1 Tax=Cryobacterium adonitolivorans TaxID=1259189 RepID=A0A4R8WFX1_9MICO|nr:hypothetical protein [Cryobacterium adonitolivorans]TFC07176.1 hypothetical protein E3O42_00060 [Cryobacterium adonitolivorans]